MLIEFSVKNFRAVKDKITLSLDVTKSKDLDNSYIIELQVGKRTIRLSRLTLIYGPNASGKSTLLDAISFLVKIAVSRTNDKTMEFQDLVPFLGSDETKKGTTEFEVKFYAEGTIYLYTLEMNKTLILKEALYRMTPKKALIFNRTTDPEKQLVDIKLGSTVKLKKEERSTLLNNTLSNSSVLGGYLKSNIFNEDFKKAVNWFKYRVEYIFPYSFDLHLPSIPSMIKELNLNKKYLTEILKSADFFIDGIKIIEEEKSLSDLNAKAREFVLALQKLLSDESQSIEESFTTYDLILTHFSEKQFDLPLKDESRGTSKFLRLIVFLLGISQKKGVGLVDELESSLHPDLIEYALSFFCRKLSHSQLIATTHYVDLLRRREFAGKYTIWFTDKKSNGSVDLYSMADFKSSDIRKERSLYNSYRAGKFGAVPDLMPVPGDIKKIKPYNDKVNFE